MSIAAPEGAVPPGFVPVASGSMVGIGCGAPWAPTAMLAGSALIPPAYDDALCRDFDGRSEDGKSGISVNRGDCDVCDVCSELVGQREAHGRGFLQRIVGDRLRGGVDDLDGIGRADERVPLAHVSEIRRVAGFGHADADELSVGDGTGVRRDRDPFPLEAAAVPRSEDCVCSPLRIGQRGLAPKVRLLCDFWNSRAFCSKSLSRSSWQIAQRGDLPAVGQDETTASG